MSDQEKLGDIISLVLRCMVVILACMAVLSVTAVLVGCERKPVTVDQAILLQIRECESAGGRTIMNDGKIICRPYEGDTP